VIKNKEYPGVGVEKASKRYIKGDKVEGLKPHSTPTSGYRPWLSTSHSKGAGTGERKDGVIRRSVTEKHPVRGPIKA